MPVGFKMSTDSNLDTAINAMKAASMPRSFMGIINQSGQVCLLQNTRQSDGTCYCILWGKKPNYHEEDVALCEAHI